MTIPALSRLCFGCEALGGTDWGEVDINGITRAVHRALELGVNFFDTAAVYGLGASEERLAAALGASRHDAFIATKGGMRWDEGKSGRAIVVRDSSPEHLRQQVEDSLRRLSVERIPMYYVHWPDPQIDPRKTFGYLTELQFEGKIGLIGCSNFSAEELRRAAEVADIAAVQLPLNILNGPVATELSDVCRRHSIGIVAYNVLANGLLTGKYNESSTFPESDRRARMPEFKGAELTRLVRRVADLQQTATNLGITVAQYAIAWVLEQPEVISAITGIKSVTQLEENLGAMALTEIRT